MSELDDDVSEESLAELQRDALQNELHTAFPARVMSYDAAKQTATIRPMVRRSMPTVSGGRIQEELPDVHGVRVCWPRAGAWFVHMPLGDGDFVLVVCAERDFSRWAQTGDVGDSIDDRNHSISHAFAIPGVYPRTASLGDTPSDALVIGKDGGATIRIKSDGTVEIGSAATQYVALSNLVTDALTTLKMAIAGAAVAANDGGATFKAALIMALSSWPSSVAAQKAKAE